MDAGTIVKPNRCRCCKTRLRLKLSIRPQAPDGIKGHEPQFWGKLEFDANGNVLPLKWVDEITIDVKLAAQTA